MSVDKNLIRPVCVCPDSHYVTGLFGIIYRTQTKVETQTAGNILVLGTKFPGTFVGKVFSVIIYTDK